MVQINSIEKYQNEGMQPQPIGNRHLQLPGSPPVGEGKTREVINGKNYFLIGVIPEIFK